MALISEIGVPPEGRFSYSFKAGPSRVSDMSGRMVPWSPKSSIISFK